MVNPMEEVPFIPFTDKALEKLLTGVQVPLNPTKELHEKLPTVKELAKTITN